MINFRLPIMQNESKTSYWFIERSTGLCNTRHQLTPQEVASAKSVPSNFTKIQRFILILALLFTQNRSNDLYAEFQRKNTLNTPFIHVAWTVRIWVYRSCSFSLVCRLLLLMVHKLEKTSSSNTYTLFQNGRNVSILLFTCELALVVSFRGIILLNFEFKNEATRVNLQENLRILKWRRFWNEVYTP